MALPRGAVPHSAVTPLYGAVTPFLFPLLTSLPQKRYTPTMSNGPRLRVVFFKTEAGGEPVRDWIKSLPREEQKLIGKRILAVQRGWPVGMPLVRKLEEDLWEVRSTLDNRIARVLFTVSGAVLVPLHGFIKKSRKTPKEDLDLARQRLRALKRRN
jgi:phage-related protein